MPSLHRRGDAWHFPMVALTRPLCALTQDCVAQSKLSFRGQPERTRRHPRNLFLLVIRPKPSFRRSENPEGNQRAISPESHLPPVPPRPPNELKISPCQANSSPTPLTHSSHSEFSPVPLASNRAQPVKIDVFESYQICVWLQTISHCPTRESPS